MTSIPSRIIAVIVVASLCTVIPSLGFGIASFVIAGQNQNLPCDHSFIYLTTWLITNAAVNLGTILLIIIMIVLFLKLKIIFFGIVTLCLLWLNILFLIAWSIVGAILLFRDGMDCQEQGSALWIMTLIALILDWLTIINSFIGTRTIKVSRN